jgi:anti-repressor protein
MISTCSATLGWGHGSARFHNESGLYSLVMTSRKPEAKRFKKWVTAEVLPTIRRTGSYVSRPTITGPEASRQIPVLGSTRHQEKGALTPSGGYPTAMDTKALANLRRKRVYIHKQLDRCSRPGDGRGRFGRWGCVGKRGRS